MIDLTVRFLLMTTTNYRPDLDILRLQKMIELTVRFLLMTTANDRPRREILINEKTNDRPHREVLILCSPSSISFTNPVLWIESHI